MKKIFFCVIILSVLASCEKTVTINIPQAAPKLVVHAWLEKNQLIEVRVGKSRHILAPHNVGNQLEEYAVKNATAVIFENNVPIDTLVYQPSTSTKRRISFCLPLKLASVSSRLLPS